MSKYIIPTPKGGMLLSTQLFANGNMAGTTAMYNFLVRGVGRDTQLSGLNDLEVFDGAFSRYPDKIENCAIDDYIGLIGSTFRAAGIINRARRYLGFLDCTDSLHFKQFMWHHLAWWQTARMSAYEEPGLLGQILWAIDIALSATKPITNQDAWIQSRYLILVASYRFGIKKGPMTWAVRFWSKKQPELTSQTVARYIGDPEHPLVDAFKLWE